MSKMKRLFFALALLSITAACNLKTHESVDVEEFKKGKEAMKIKRVTDDQIVNAAYTLGDSLSSKLQQAIQAKKQPFCDFNDLTTFIQEERLQEIVSNAGIRCQEAQTTHPKEAALWQAYLTGYQQNSELQSGIQRLGTKDNYAALAFTTPLTQQQGDSTVFSMLSIIISKSEIIKTF